MGDNSSSALNWALRLAARGFLVFPLRPGTKEPYRDELWAEIMTRDSEQVSAWFEHRPSMNYGICPGSSGVVVDLDKKGDIDGVDIFELMQLEHGDVHDTFRVKTPSGGEHYYFTVEEAASNANRFPEGIDVRGARGYVVGPGCALENGSSYEVVSDADAVPAPEWVRRNLTRKKESSEVEVVSNVDTEEAISRGREFLTHRDPAIEGMGGDHHTLVTAMCLMDFGLSKEKVMELLTEPHMRLTDTGEHFSWNDRCEPPWDIYGRKGTLEEKVDNAGRYRERDIGSKGDGSMDDPSYLLDVEDVQTALESAQKNAEEGAEGRFARIRKHMFRGGDLFARGKRREFLIPGWLPGHGIVANLARRGGGKTTVLVDLGLHIAHDMDWHGTPIKEGLTCVYICGEDDEGAEEQVRAWCLHNNIDKPSDRFVFLDIITDLMSAEDTREWAEALRAELGDKRCVIIMDTWQRASSRGGQNKDEDMQLAVHHAEALARTLNGPAIVAFHPPKHDSTMVMGSSVIENSTTAIWSMTDVGQNRKLEVTRIKGRGVGNYHLFTFQQVDLGESDEFGEKRTGIVPIRMGGVESGPNADYEVRRDMASIMKEIEVRRKDHDPSAKKHYSISKMAKMIADEIPAMEIAEDSWGQQMMESIREAGLGTTSWQAIDTRIKQVFSNDGAGHDMGDGTVLKVYQDGGCKRVKVESGGIGS